MNLGATAWVLAGVCSDRIRVWHYVDKRWNAATAVEAYQGPIQSALKKHRPEKSVWRIVEDNDPSGYKTAKARAAKKALDIEPMEWPGYSPDLNPLDFSLWKAVEERAREAIGQRQVSAKEYKRVLRQAALRLPARVVRSAVADMRRRIAACYENNGGNIPRD